MATLVPTVVFNVASWLGLNPLLATNFHGINVALRERVVGQRLSVPRYAATSDPATEIRLGYTSPPGSVPWAVLLVRVRETHAPGGDVAATGRLNFGQDGPVLYIREPLGLSANVFYDLEFLVLES